MPNIKPSEMNNFVDTLSDGPFFAVFIEKIKTVFLRKRGSIGFMLTQQHRSLNRFAFCLKTHDLTDHIINSPIHKSDIHKTPPKKFSDIKCLFTALRLSANSYCSDNGQRVINIFLQLPFLWRCRTRWRRCALPLF